MPTEQLPPPGPAVTVEIGPAVETGPAVIDPAQWRTVAEIDATDRAITARLARALDDLQDRPVLPARIVDG